MVAPNLLVRTAGLLLITAFLAACAAAPGQAASGAAPGPSGARIELSQLYGLSFSTDGRRLLVPAYRGLKIYEDGYWHEGVGLAHDFSGYAASDDGFYASGRTASGSELAGTLGLVKSGDEGLTLTHLAFGGAGSFRVFGVGYHNHAIYLFNPDADVGLDPGLHYSLDDGKSWQASAAQGLSGEPLALAVHPSDPATVAAATADGLMFSSDYGATFSLVSPDEVVRAVTFSPDGIQLLYGTKTLAVYNLVSTRTEEYRMPQLAPDDTITFVAISPLRPKNVAVATEGRDIFLTINGGRAWEQLAARGVNADQPVGR